MQCRGKSSQVIAEQGLADDNDKIIACSIACDRPKHRILSVGSKAQVRITRERESDSLRKHSRMSTSNSSFLLRIKCQKNKVVEEILCAVTVEEQIVK